MAIREKRLDHNERNSLPSVGFVSLGCAKNLVDSEVIASGALSSGLPLAKSPDTADIIVVNTCSFIRDAREESIDAILSACALKQAGRAKAVVVAGCLPQRYKRSLSRELPEVDAFIGLDNLVEAGEIIRRLANGERRIYAVSDRSRIIIEPPAHRPIFTGGYFAYLKVAEGCDHACSFCAIPKIRGRHRSRRPSSILREAELLLERGYRELVLISQDTMSYGRDLGGRASLPSLLKELSKIGGQFWIRLLYGHPSGVDRALLNAMASVRQVCHYFDLPVQHADDGILRAMNRRETNESLRRVFREIREALPDAVLRTTFLVGFPGETEKKFQNLLDFQEEIRFDHVGVFTFSREENTRARNLRPIPRAAEERRRRALEAQRKIVREKARDRLGSRDLILLESEKNSRTGELIGRSRGLAPEVDGRVIVLARSGGLEPGSFAEARYTSFRGYDMRAVEA